MYTVTFVIIRNFLLTEFNFLMCSTNWLCILKINIVICKILKVDSIVKDTGCSTQEQLEQSCRCEMAESEEDQGENRHRTFSFFAFQWVGTMSV